jgi:hypothetical protein
MSKIDQDNPNAGVVAPTQGVKPSTFMKRLRPEYYSDSVERTKLVLSASQLEYRLETITARNETHDFEIFCRKLCERAICPNLRPQTGPDGGGDSKADSETYPVADEISGLTYIGNANACRERWAFAFSAKATWAAKARKDVEGIAGTNRGYDRIFFVTSRFAKAKDRAHVEDELTTKFGLPVVIHDRTWIVQEIIEKDRADLAFNYLKVGEELNSHRLGPIDYSRTQQLCDIEQAIADPQTFVGMERQLVTEAMLAAKISRNLERPRIETEGRFVRACRLAQQHGSQRQQLEALYEQIWTNYWWFDDAIFLNERYADVEALALKSRHSKTLELLGNLHQLLVNCLMHQHLPRDACLLEERTERLRTALEAELNDSSRPNNSLEAQTGLLRIDLNHAMMAKDNEALSSLWKAYASVLEKARGLGEYDADGVVRFIEVTGNIAGNDSAYNSLVEKLAEFVSQRTSEAEGALILLKRARKLDFAEKFGMIRWLGKAAVGLSKREYSGELIEALQLLTLAYRSAGLQWASRAACIFALATIIMEGEVDGELPVSIVPTTKLWAWNSLQLSHLPDLFSAIQLMNGFVASLPLSDESREKVTTDIRELDAALGCLLLNLNEADLSRLEGVPDILEALGLYMARIALLFSLGHSDVLRKDGSLPNLETDERVQELLAMLKSQPLADQLRGPLLLNGAGPQTLRTTLLGMTVEVEIAENGLVPLAEGILASLEAFFATLADKEVAPHAEAYRITVEVSGDLQVPTIETSELDLTTKVLWPSGLQLVRLDHQSAVHRFYCELASHVFGAACWVKEPQTIMADLVSAQAVSQRITMITTAPTSYNRLTSRSFSQLSDWQGHVQETYPLREQKTILPMVPSQRTNASVVGDGEYGDNVSHSDMRVRSVVDVHAWDKARWRGCGYLHMGLDQPPAIALLFESEEAAQKIFERWRSRFGANDTKDEIGISIIRALPGAPLHHYCVQIAPGMASFLGCMRGPVAISARSMTMEPADGRNLEMFLAGFQRFGMYDLIPAVIGAAEPNFMFGLAIRKRLMSVKVASEISANDIEYMALRQRGTMDS